MDRYDSIAMIFMAALFLLLIAALGAGMQQQKDCDAACAPARSITPVVGGQNICLCDEGQGKWRRQELID